MSLFPFLSDFSRNIIDLSAAIKMRHLWNMHLNLFLCSDINFNYMQTFSMRFIPYNIVMNCVYNN